MMLLWLLIRVSYVCYPNHYITVVRSKFTGLVPKVYPDFQYIYYVKYQKLNMYSSKNKSPQMIQHERQRSHFHSHLARFLPFWTCLLLSSHEPDSLNMLLGCLPKCLNTYFCHILLILSFCSLLKALCQAIWADYLLLKQWSTKVQNHLRMQPLRDQQGTDIN